jgi:hypothetical protein
MTWDEYYAGLGELRRSGECGALYTAGFVCYFCGGRDEHLHGCEHPYVISGQYSTVASPRGTESV